MCTQNRQRSWLQRLFQYVITAGPIPQHVALILDGNRRYAANNDLPRSEGHLKGFNNAAENIETCFEVGIVEITAYAFSIENFKRSSDEVEALIELFRQQFFALSQDGGLFQLWGSRVQIFGDITLFPRDLQEILAWTVTRTENYKKRKLNFCLAYTARDDICMAMREMAAGVKDGYIRHTDISQSLLEKCLYTSHCQSLDMTIRTAGEVRLSDFMLWESSYCFLFFLKVLWPEFGVWNLYGAILLYQRSYKKIQTAHQRHLSERERLQRESDLQCVMEESKKAETLDEPRADMGHSSDSCNIQQQKSVQVRVQQYAAEREKRTEAFLAHVYERRKQFIKSLLPTHSFTITKPI